MAKKLGLATDIINDGRMVGWHFISVNDQEELVMRDGTVIAKDKEGDWLPEINDIVMCSSGYHASISLLDALSYATDGRALCLVELGGKVIANEDKVVASKRRILARIDVHPLLVQYANDSKDNAERMSKYTADINDAIIRVDKNAVKELLKNKPAFHNHAAEVAFCDAVASMTLSSL